MFATRKTISLMFLLVIGAVSARPANAAEAKKLKLTFTETSLGKLLPGTRGHLVFSPDGRHVAFPVKRSGGWVMVLDGAESKPYEWIMAGSLAFCPDNKRVAFQVQRGDRMLTVVGDEEGKDFKEVMPPVIFSKDGKRVAYTARLEAKSKGVVAVVDGAATKEYEKIGAVGFSPDGKRFVMRVESEGKRFWTIDGKEDPQCDGVGPLVFSRDGLRYGYMAQHGLKECMLIDGVEGKAYEKVGALVFSDDAKRTVHAATRGRKQFIVTDGAEGKEYDLVGVPAISPNGKRVAYEAMRSKRCMVVVDGEEGRTYDQVGDASFSADGQHVAYRAIAEHKWVMVVDGKEGDEYDRIGEFAISPDGKRLAFGARRGTDDFLVLDGKEVPGAGSVTMSPDGRYVAHAKDMPTGPGHPASSVLYINDTLGREYQGFLKGSPWVWEGNKLTLLAAKELEIIRVEVTIEEQ